MPGSVEERIVEALRGERSSQELNVLLKGVQDHMNMLTLERSETERTALDPETSSKEVSKLRAQISEIDFSRSRTEVAIGRLNKALDEARAREEQGRRREAYAYAQELLTTANDMMARVLLELSSALKVAADAERVALEVNAALPKGEEPLAIPDNVASEKILGERDVNRWCSGAEIFEDEEVVTERPGATVGTLRPRAKFVNLRPFKEVRFRRRGSTVDQVRYERLPD